MGYAKSSWGKKGGKTGSPKGKGKGKGKTQFSGQCNHRRNWGHSQKWCPKEKGTQKGQNLGRGWGKPGQVTHTHTHNVEEEPLAEDPSLGSLEKSRKRQCWVLGSCETAHFPQDPPQTTPSSFIVKGSTLDGGRTDDQLCSLHAARAAHAALVADSRSCQGVNGLGPESAWKGISSGVLRNAVRILG